MAKAPNLTALRESLSKSNLTSTKLDDYTLLVDFYPQLVLGSARRLLNEMVKNLKSGLILDAGCGKGWVSLELTKKGFKVVGIDLSDERISEAKALFESENIHVPLIKASLTNLPLKDTTFNSVISFHVIEHILNVGLAFSELSRVIARDGSLYLTVPNGFGSSEIINDIVLPAIWNRFARRGIEHKHVQKFTVNNIKTLAEYYHFKITNFINLQSFTPFYAILFNTLHLQRTARARRLLENADVQSAEKLPKLFGSSWLIICKKTHYMIND
jgi:ubiquinone/menaquinone biosynthesis C-methylase UbiE